MPFDATSKSNWPILINYITESGKVGRVMLKEEPLILEIDELVWFNNQLQGFYLCFYSDISPLVKSLHKFPENHFAILLSMQLSY